MCDGAASLTVAAPGASNTALLKTTRALDSVTRTAIDLQEVPQGGSDVYVSLLLRRQSDRGYLAKIHVLTGGAVRLAFSRSSASVETAIGDEVDTRVTVVGGQRLNIEVEIVGTDVVTLRSRVWTAPASAPDWHTATDSAPMRIVEPGAVGLMVYLSRSAPAPRR